jgi:hypothetical protein
MGLPKGMSRHLQTLQEYAESGCCRALASRQRV